MIIVKDKGAKSPIYVPRNVNLQPSNTNNSGEGGIDMEELNKYLEDYVTETELNNKGYLTKIPSEYVTETELNDKDYATNTKVNDKQDRLVSGYNIKSINGENILGDGDITIKGGSTNIIELTQEEYDNLEEKDENTLYIITDAPAIDTPDTSIFITENELLEMGYATQGYVDEKLGDIETILNNIIGQE